jgi:hypothetical protein
MNKALILIGISTQTKILPLREAAKPESVPVFGRTRRPERRAKVGEGAKAARRRSVLRPARFQALKHARRRFDRSRPPR